MTFRVEVLKFVSNTLMLGRLQVSDFLFLKGLRNESTTY